MENNIKKKIKIADLIENKKKYQRYQEYGQQLRFYCEQFEKFKLDYEELKNQEPLKSKIETLKKVFSFDEKNYNAENPGPTDEEIDLVKDLCLSPSVKLDYYERLGIDKNQKPIFFSEDNEPTQTEDWMELLAKIKSQLWWIGCFAHREKLDSVFDDKAIKETIIHLPSFEMYFQKSQNIKKPAEVDFIDYESWHCNIIEMIEADDFIYFLSDEEKKKQFEFVLDNEFIRSDNYCRSFGKARLPIEIESSLLSLLQNDTLNKFDVAEKLLNFYYDQKLRLRFQLRACFSFAYKVIDLFDKKIATANRKAYSQSFSRLCQCASKCAAYSVLGYGEYDEVLKILTYDNTDTISSVEEIFRYVDIFEKQDTASFNLTDEVLRYIKSDIANIFSFMQRNALIDENIPSLESFNLHAISANGWDCFCELVINFFTHFISLWDGILFNGNLKIEKSAQLRKFVNFLRETQINQVPSNLTSQDFQEVEVLDQRNEIKFTRYDETSIFQAFQNLRMTLPEIPKQENNSPDNLLS